MQLERILEKMVGGSRAAVLRALESGTRSVGEVVAETRLSQPNVSNHLSRLRELGLVAAERVGRKVFYQITSPDLVRALLSSPPRKALSEAERNEIIAAAYPVFEAAVIEGDHETARSVVDRALADGLPWTDLYTRVFARTLVKTGELWAAGEWTNYQEHASSRLIERLMSHVGSLRVPARRAGQCDVVVACAEGERHELGARMASDFLSAERLNVSFLGADIPSADLVACVRDTRPAVLCVSATTEDRIPALRDLAAQLKKRLGAGETPVVFLAGLLLQQRPGLAAELGMEAAPSDLGEFCTAVKRAIQ